MPLFQRKGTKQKILNEEIPNNKRSSDLCYAFLNLRYLIARNFHRGTTTFNQNTRNFEPSRKLDQISISSPDQVCLLVFTKLAAEE